MGELRALLRQLDDATALPAGGASAAAAAAQEVPSVEDLRTTLTGGLQHCLRWLYGLEFPGLDKQEEWGGDFQVRPAAWCRGFCFGPTSEALGTGAGQARGVVGGCGVVSGKG